MASTMAELLQIFRMHVTDICWGLEDSGFFQNRDELPKNQRKFLEAVLKNTVPDLYLFNVLFKLTENLHAVLHQKQAVVLIDEYDTPMSHAVRDGYSSEVCLNQVPTMCILTHSLRSQICFSIESSQVYLRST